MNTHSNHRRFLEKNTGLNCSGRGVRITNKLTLETLLMLDALRYDIYTTPLATVSG